MEKRPKRYMLRDYLFWIFFVLFTNPGGILDLLKSSEGSGFGMKDLLMAPIFLLYLDLRQKRKYLDERFLKILKYLFIFGIYFFIVYGFFIPIFKETFGYSTFDFIKKGRKTLYSLLLVPIVYTFYLRSYNLFLKIFIFSSLIVFILFFITVFLRIDLLPVDRGMRDFIVMERILMRDYGLLPFFIQMGIILFIFKTNINLKKMIFMGFIFMFLAWLISITRRQILGTIISFFIAFILYNYFQRKSLLPIGKIVSTTLFITGISLLLSFVLPKYAQATIKGVEEAVFVIQNGESSSGRKDVRLGFGKKKMQSLITNNFVFGTGFDYRWQSSEGDSMGYEAADYPLLSAIAMTGIMGIIFFLPIYIILIKSIIFDVKYLRDHNINYNSIEFYFFMVLILFFIFDLLQYINWFTPVSLSRYEDWYVNLALYFAARFVFYNKQNLDLKRKDKLWLQ